MNLCLILGTRPDIIKMSPIIRECERRKVQYFILHTGQHYSHNMDKLFFEELNLPQPKYNLGIGSSTEPRFQVKVMIDKLMEILKKEKPRYVLVYGDTNTSLAGSLAANRLQIPSVHIESGLRSFDIIMTEEINRMLSDHLAYLLFTPTDECRQNLLREGISEDKVFCSGNTIVDAVYQNIELGKKQKPLHDGDYFVVTAHRPESVDVEDRLRGILKGLQLVAREFNLPIIFSLHPRTRKMLDTFKIDSIDSINFIEPPGYLDFLNLLSNANLVLTDSGGLQEECCILKVPCITLRENTERPETLRVGSNMLSGVDPEKILHSAKIMHNKDNNWENPYGDGKAAQKILDVIAVKSL